MTGTSKRMSWLGLATLTTVRERRRVVAEGCDVSLGVIEEFAGAEDGGVGALHGFDGDAGLGGDDDGLAEIEGGNAAGDRAAVGDVFELFGVRERERSGCRVWRAAAPGSPWTR